MRLTDKAYKCGKCDELHQLVKFRGSASFCKKCYGERREEQKALRELNAIGREIRSQNETT